MHARNLYKQQIADLPAVILILVRQWSRSDLQNSKNFKPALASFRKNSNENQQRRLQEGEIRSSGVFLKIFSIYRPRYLV